MAEVYAQQNPIQVLLIHKSKCTWEWAFGSGVGSTCHHHYLIEKVHIRVAQAIPTVHLGFSVYHSLLWLRMSLALLDPNIFPILERKSLCEVYEKVLCPVRSVIVIKLFWRPLTFHSFVHFLHLSTLEQWNKF